MLKNLLLGNTYLQPLYEFLFRVAVKGMNYDRGHIPNHSGERYVLELLQKQAKQEKLTIFDVGANTGQYAEVVINTLKKDFHLYSFEPQQEAFNQLKNISDASFFSPHQVAVGSAQGEVEIFYNREGSVFASMFPASYQNYDISLDKSQKVPMITLDNFCKKHNISQIDFLKIDVEGYEIEVLKGCQQLIKEKKVKMIQFEFGIASIKARIFLEDFFTILSDYDIYRVLQNGIRKIRYSEYAELFLTTNYLAIRKT